MRVFRRREAKGEGFARPDGMPEALHRLLTARGVSSVEEARAFLKPDASLLNPASALRGIPEAADALRGAIARGERLCVYGDYDVDGVSASAILTLALRRMGAQAEAYLPSRHEEGYGLNENAIRRIAERFSLMITVDCGVTSVELVALARELGLAVVVTDHHRPGSVQPDCLVVNPLLGGYPNPALCGAGVAFKLAEALLGREAAMEFVDLAALATVADVVPLAGENRAITKLGLDAMNRAPRLGLAQLRAVAGLSEKPFTAGMLGFQIGPRLNASGRVGSARRAYELLTADSPDRARALAEELDAENTRRKRLEEAILSDALSQLESFDFPAHRAIVLAGEGWNSGVIGLAASRLVERFHYPAILVSLDGDTGVGSCRSIPGIDIHAALTETSEFLVRFGGHRQAAGLTIRRENLPAFSDALDRALRAADPALYVPCAEYDLDAQFSELDSLLVAMTEMFAPTGMGNPAPVFRSRARVVEARRVGGEGAHLSLKLSDGTNTMRAIAFREGENAARLSGAVDCLYAPFRNEYGGRTSVELEIKAIVPAGESEILTRAQAEEGSLLAAFLTEMIYNRSYSEKLPSRGAAAENRAPAGSAHPVDAESPRSECARNECGDLAIGSAGDIPRKDPPSRADLPDRPSAERAIVPDWGASVTAVELSGWLAASPQGTLIIAASAECASGYPGLDLFVGCYPDDPRAFNSVCVLPTGAVPRGFTRIVYAGIPALSGAWTLDCPRAEWTRALPGINELRRAYVAARRMVARPLVAGSLAALARSLTDESNLDFVCAAASILVLIDMNLVTNDGAWNLSLGKSGRVDPLESAAYRAIRALREEV